MTRRQGRLQRALSAATLIFAIATATPAYAAPAFVTTHGYMRMKDGELLRYALTRPSSRGRFPAVLVYGPYQSGQNNLAEYPYLRELLAQGFAIIGVNFRGTGCSTGETKLLDPQNGIDGAAAVEWIARQPWSTGRVGMTGISFEGISQLLVAAQRPPHLDAIAPGQVIGDVYREVAHPGGVGLNRGYAAIYVPTQAFLSSKAAIDAVSDGDPRCLANLGLHDPTPLADQAVEAAQSPFIDSGFPYEAISPDAILDRIEVPVLITRTWQDGETSSRNSYILENLNRRTTWSIATNGGHVGFYGFEPRTNKAMARFFRRYLMGEQNGWERVPRVQVLHEFRSDTRAAWASSFPSWPPPTRALSLYLHDGGRLLRSKPTEDAARSYIYPTLAPSAPDNDIVGFYGSMFGIADPTPGVGWMIPPTPGGYLAYTTPPLSEDAEILGSGTADLWLSSTATDTDLQITLTEVRPDGQEAYLQRGWLRASHRKEDRDHSTVLRPLHTHSWRDEQPLVPGRPAHMRVELHPVGHVFRKGSAIRLIIEAPTGMTGDWALDFLPTPAVNTILNDAAHPSRVVLPLVAGHAHAPMPTCGTIVNEPCRTSIAPVPSGLLRP